MIFDGGKLMAKDTTEGKRDDKRKKASEAGIHLLKKANALPKGSREAERLRNEATSYFQQAVSISPAVMAITIEALKKHKFDFIIAPYEADAQLAYEMKIRSGCDVIITEDSDVMVYCLAAGATNAKVIFKMDRNGIGTLVDLKKFSEKQVSKTSNSPKKKKGKGKKRRDVFIENLHKLTPKMFVQTAVLAGCDYCDSIKGIGIKKAQLLVVKFAKVPDEERILKIINHVEKTDKKKFIPLNYETNVRNAMLTFMHHWVCDTRLGAIRMVNLNELPQDVVDTEYLSEAIGEKYNSDVLRKIVKGIIHPRTKKKYKEFLASTPSSTNSSVKQRMSTYSSKNRKRYNWSSSSGVSSSNSSSYNQYNNKNNNSGWMSSRISTDVNEYSSSVSSFNMPKASKIIQRKPAIAVVKLVDSPSQSFQINTNNDVNDRHNAMKNNTNKTSTVSAILQNLSNLNDTIRSKDIEDNEIENQIEGATSVSDLATPGKHSILSKMPTTTVTAKTEKVPGATTTLVKNTDNGYANSFYKKNNDQKTMNNFFLKVESNPLLAREASVKRNPRSSRKSATVTKKVSNNVKSNVKTTRTRKKRKKKKNIVENDKKMRKLTSFFSTRKDIP